MVSALVERHVTSAEPTDHPYLEDIVIILDLITEESVKRLIVPLLEICRALGDI